MKKVFNLSIAIGFVLFNLLAFQNCSQPGLTNLTEMSSNGVSSALETDSNLVKIEDFQSSTLKSISESSNPQISGTVISSNKNLNLVIGRKCASKTSAPKISSCFDKIAITAGLVDSNSSLYVDIYVSYLNNDDLKNNPIVLTGKLRNVSSGLDVVSVNIPKSKLAGNYKIKVPSNEDGSIVASKYKFYVNSEAQSLLEFTVPELTASKSSTLVESSTSQTSQTECQNGAKNYPDCDAFAACPNGAINSPTGSDLSKACNVCAEGYSLQNSVCSKIPQENVFQGVGYNAISCDQRNFSIPLEAGKTACVGLWDEGSAWGEDQHQCLDSRGIPTDKCVISNNDCASGKAEAKLVEYSPDKRLIHLSKFSDDGSLIIKTYNRQAGVNLSYSHSLGKLLAMWEYKCVGASQSTEVVSYKGCQLNSKIEVPHGGSIVAYQKLNLESGVCVSEVRSCNNGFLSGSYLYDSCTVSAKPEVDKNIKNAELDKLKSLAAMDFNEAEYLMLYPDVKEAVENKRLSSGLEHYRIYGAKEGRSPSLLFNEKLIAAEFRRYVFSGKTAWESYISNKTLSSIVNLRYFSHFDEEKYLETHLDVKQAIKLGILSDGLEHYIKYGRTEGRRVFIKNQ